jgi:hypothetical protein
MRRNEETWKTGDVVELFLQNDGSPDYYEFHLTPENQRLQLHFPDAAALRSGLPLRTWMVEKEIFESFTRVDMLRMRWQALMRINLSSLWGARPRRLRFLAGRYDAQPDGARAVASASGRLTAFDFHNLPEWSRGELASIKGV